MVSVALILLFVLSCIVLRLISVIRRTRTRFSDARPTPPKTCSLAVFLGSGGHTSEALVLLSALDFSRYSPRKYIYSQGDILSAKKAVNLESLKAPECTSHPVHSTDATTPYTLVSIPRARRVHQSLFTTPVTAARSLITCLYHVTIAPLLSGHPFADVLVVNGPGTCCMLCLAVYVNRFFGFHSPKMIYVESFARVKTLSLSGKLLRPFVDRSPSCRFVVQWPELLNDGGRGECRGWLI
ncbi:unnamed protein product [Somion occarium]|uniref:UDP-N-acetylglucosamine transferase subunit ALG14 n=1 Tax=Somion occarium TaxID=3059160 RepID=A0ABP1DGB7_9APHY